MGWWVEGILDDDRPNARTGELSPRALTRVFHCYQAALDYAAYLRARVRLPNAVTVRTKEGYDDIEELERL